MPIKTTDESTGIYRRVTKRIVWPPGTPSAQKRRDLRALLTPQDINQHLDDLEKSAKKIIKEHGGFPGWRSGTWFPLPSNAGLAAKRAVELVFDAWFVRDTLKKLERENPKFAHEMQVLTFGAYKLGRRAEMVRVSPLEPAVRTGAKIRRAYAEARSNRTKALAPRNATIRTEAKHLAERRSSLTATAIAHNLAKRFGLSTRHIRNIIKGSTETGKS